MCSADLFLLLAISAALAAAVASIFYNLGNGIGSYIWQMISIAWIWNFWRVAKMVDEMDDPSDYN